MVAEPQPTVSTPFMFEDPQYMFDTPQSDVGGVDEMENMKEQCQTLERRLRAIKGNDVFGATTMDMCLVSDLIIPAKFKTPNFEKYKGYTCPKSHLIMYYRKMEVHSRNDKFLIHYFQDSLSEASLKWYMSLERTLWQ